MSRIMLDLETMGNKPTSAIIAIGAVKFGNGEILDRFYQKISLESSMDAGLTVDASTIIWWMNQSDDARKEFKDNDPHIDSVLIDFWVWCGEVNEMWGNGASFDNTILSNAYDVVGIEKPWKFWQDRCYRTIKASSPIELKRVGTHHNALNDAESQALHLMEIE